MHTTKYSKAPRKVKNEAAVTLGRLGGRARAKKLTKDRRSEIASQAARARWQMR